MRMMQSITIGVAIFMAAGIALPTPADSGTTRDQRAEIVDDLATKLETHYVYESDGRAMATLLRKNLANGRYDGDLDDMAFAEQLQSAIRSVREDKHLRVSAPRGKGDGATKKKKKRRTPSISSVHRVEVFDGNIGYMDLRGFGQNEEWKHHVDGAMAILRNADAWIFDLRKNNGGGGEAVSYLAGYLFDERTHLVTHMRRGESAEEEIWSASGDVAYDGRPEVPVYVLTSSHTFSAAEAFTFGMKSSGRATIVGERTGGGGHFGGPRPLPGDFSIWLPVGRAYNPETGLGWEADGIRPDVAVPAEDALDQVLAIARPVAAERMQERIAAREALRNRIMEILVNAGGLVGDGKVDAAGDMLNTEFQSLHDEGNLDEGMVNDAGYHALGGGNATLARLVLEWNVTHYPESPNVHDSLGEALAMEGDVAGAIASYQRVLDLDPDNQYAKGQIAKLEGLASAGS